MTTKISIEQVRDHLLTRPPRAVEGAEKMRRSAVAAIFRAREDGAAELLFMRRASHKKDPWSGQISFPGGRQDPEDLDLTQTAARETREEVGLDLSKGANRLGLLDELQARARGNILPMSIQPIAFVLPKGPRPTLTHNEEVDSTFWVPLHELPDPELRTYVQAERANHPMSFPGVDLGSHGVLWGLTWMMVVEVLHRLGAIPETQPLVVPRQRAT